MGETIRIYFGVGGPNKTSSFHMIGEIFDKVYQLGSFIETPISDVQTVSVPPGGAVAVDVTLEVPGTYALVDHALSRMERGLVAHLVVEGEENPEIFGPLPNEQISMLPKRASLAPRRPPEHPAGRFICGCGIRASLLRQAK